MGGEVLVKMIWGDELLQDDESGVNRQLGFVFLYMVLLGQLTLELNGMDVTSSLGRWVKRNEIDMMKNGWIFMDFEGI